MDTGANKRSTQSAVLCKIMFANGRGARAARTAGAAVGRGTGSPRAPPGRRTRSRVGCRVGQPTTDESAPAAARPPAVYENIFLFYGSEVRGLPQTSTCTARPPLSTNIEYTFSWYRPGSGRRSASRSVTSPQEPMSRKSTHTKAPLRPSSRVVVGGGSTRAPLRHRYSVPTPPPAASALALKR